MRTLDTILETRPSLGYRKSLEITFQCPVCLAIETLFFEDQRLTASHHWKVEDGKIYHRECGKPAVVISMTKRFMWMPSETAALLFRLIEQKIVTLSNIAEYVGVSRTTVRRWLLDECSPNRTSRRKLATFTRSILANNKDMPLQCRKRQNQD